MKRTSKIIGYLMIFSSIQFSFLISISSAYSMWWVRQSTYGGFAKAPALFIEHNSEKGKIELSFACYQKNKTYSMRMSTKLLGSYTSSRNLYVDVSVSGENFKIKMDVLSSIYSNMPFFESSPLDSDVIKMIMDRLYSHSSEITIRANDKIITIKEDGYFITAFEEFRESCKLG